MQALFSGIVGKLVLFILGATVIGTPVEKRSTVTLKCSGYPAIRNILIVYSADTTETAEKKIKRDLEIESKRLEAEMEKEKKELKSLKISITDKGLRVVFPKILTTSPITLPSILRSPPITTTFPRTSSK